MQYAQADIELINKTYVAFIGNARNNNVVGGRSVNNIPKDPYQIQFQFPPRIRSDSKSGEWQETKTLMLSEPIAIFKNGNPRTFSLKWEYLVDGDIWTTERIANICRNLRGYFARTDMKYIKRADIGLYTVYFKLWLHGDAEKMTCRIENVNITHSETIIIPETEDLSRGVNKIQGSAQNVIDIATDSSENVRGAWDRHKFAFPLKTEITLDMKIWTMPYSTTQQYIDQSGGDVKSVATAEDLSSLLPIRFGWF